jgi:hypothetical protein
MKRKKRRREIHSRGKGFVYSLERGICGTPVWTKEDEKAKF